MNANGLTDRIALENEAARIVRDLGLTCSVEGLADRLEKIIQEAEKRAIVAYLCDDGWGRRNMEKWARS